MESSLSIRQAIKESHSKITKLSKNNLLSQGNVDDVQYWSNLFQEELTRHSFAEKLVLHPAFEKHLPNQSQQILHQAKHEHENMAKLLFSLQRTSISDPEYRSILTQLVHYFNEHIQREEKDEIRKLESALTSDENTSLAKQFQQTKESSHLKLYPKSSIDPPL